MIKCWTSRSCVRASWRYAAAVAVVALLVGCAAKPRATPRPVAAMANTDPCAMRLHDLSGDLLLYYARQGELPATLGEFAGQSASPGAESAAACPVSELPYVYNPRGIFMPEQGVRVVLYDSAPVHAGMRWAVTIDEPRPGEPLVTKVIGLPESFFLLHPPGP